ncbi:hypothetical protein QVE09_25080 [Paenibacillus sp. ClWae2A]|uniref:hypothetical protein n=1 Tax=Paenibacillus sp. ClWae2A TaxID=3057177 RepID=UPI0028F4DE4F|nr:hypothetical protein [Paenibacillus sp. ClWae2A]MDT9722187.1 hypothetical protein [Paenibacillus sp. ClWae2A]
MKNDHLLLINNEKKQVKKFKMYKNSIVYRLDKPIFNGSAIKDIIGFVNAVEEKYHKVKLPIHFDLGNIKITDKLTYIIFECICNYLLQTCKRKVTVSFSAKEEINTEGIGSSPLLLLGTSIKDPLKFSQKFKKEIYKSHYRRVIETEENKDPYLLSMIMSDLDTFLKTFSVTKQYRDAITEVIIELAGNALEHTNTDCLIDLDVTEPYNKKETTDTFYGINITILNFSPKLLGYSISEKIKNKEMLNERHSKLLDAYTIHKQGFNSLYSEEDFYNIASFQHKISGRLKNESTGGTGLTKLIHRLEDYSDAYHCYVLTGRRGLFFERDFLSYNEEGWIGFNAEKDFLTKNPQEKLLINGHITMPGTAYNLNFVMKKEE